MNKRTENTASDSSFVSHSQSSSLSLLNRRESGRPPSYSVPNIPSPDNIATSQTTSSTLELFLSETKEFLSFSQKADANAQHLAQNLHTTTQQTDFLLRDINDTRYIQSLTAKKIAAIEAYLKHYSTWRECSQYIKKEHCNLYTIVPMISLLIRVKAAQSFFKDHQNLYQAREFESKLKELKKCGIEKVDATLPWIINGQAGLLALRMPSPPASAHSIPTPWSASTQDDWAGISGDMYSTEAEGPAERNHHITEDSLTEDDAIPYTESLYPSQQSAPSREKILNTLQEVFHNLDAHFHNESRYRKVYREERKRHVVKLLQQRHAIYRDALLSVQNKFSEKNRLKETIGKLSKLERMSRMIFSGKEKDRKLLETYNTPVSTPFWSHNDPLSAKSSSPSVSSTLTPPIEGNKFLSHLQKRGVCNTSPSKFTVEKENKGTYIKSTIPKEKKKRSSLTVNTAAPVASDAGASLASGFPMRHRGYKRPNIITKFSSPLEIPTPTSVRPFDLTSASSEQQSPLPEPPPISGGQHVRAVIAYIDDLCQRMSHEWNLITNLFALRDRKRVMFKIFEDITTHMKFIVETMLKATEVITLVDVLSLVEALEDRYRDVILKGLFDLCEVSLGLLVEECKEQISLVLWNYQLLQKTFESPNESIAVILGEHHHKSHQMEQLMKPSTSALIIHPACAYVDSYFRILNHFGHTVAVILREKNMIHLKYASSNDANVLAQHKQLVVGSILNDCNRYMKKMKSPTSRVMMRLNTLSFILERLINRENLFQQKQQYDCILDDEIEVYIRQEWGSLLKLLGVWYRRSSLMEELTSPDWDLLVQNDSRFRDDLGGSGSLDMMTAHSPAARYSSGTSTSQFKPESSLEMDMPLSRKFFREVYSQFIELFDTQKNIIVYNRMLMLKLRSAVENHIMKPFEDHFKRYHVQYEIELKRDPQLQGLTPEKMRNWIANLYRFSE